MTIFGDILWLVPPFLLLAGLFGAAAIAALLTCLVRAGGPVDLPRERGAHSTPTPTSGGLAIMAATAIVSALVLVFAGEHIPGNWRDGAFLFGFAALMGLSGALDDLFDLPPLLRLGFQIATCIGFAWVYRVTSLHFGPGMNVDLPPLAGVIGSAAWLVLGINTINFMDGANGLAPGTQAISLGGFVVLIVLLAPISQFGSFLGVILLICACAAGAHLGFMPFNLPPRQPNASKAFQGDAGALFGGALITGTTLVVKAYGVGSVWFGGFLLAPLLVDVVLTLITRARQRKALMRPHKEHLYQLWLQRQDPNHAGLALRVWFLCALSSAAGVAARVIDIRQHTDVRFFCLVVVIAIYSFLWVTLRRRLLAKPPLCELPAE